MKSQRPSTDRWGIDDRYRDVQGGEHVLRPETRAALLAAMGVDRSDSAEAALSASGPYADVVVVQGPPGDAARWTSASAGELRLEDGSTCPVRAGQTLALPFGYCDFQAAGAHRSVRLIAGPTQCHLPATFKTWGWAAQLYATRSRASWGIGDLADLRTLKQWARRQGAGALMINPLVAATPVRPLEPSPYYPSSRRFRNPIYLRVEEVPGAATLGAELDRLAAAGRALNRERRIDRDAIFALKMQALERCFAHGTDDAAFEGYRVAQGPALEQFATFCALAEREGKDWRRWPDPLRRPDSAAVTTFARDQRRRVTFHAWLQWLLDQQLAAASSDIAVIQDLPIGLDVAGADAWCWQELLAHDVSVGAPPDELNPAGQDWGLTPFVPHRMRAAGYQPFIETIRATLQHAGGLRIDHVMGLFRLFWIPRGGGPEGGGFVRTRADELLAIVALESTRSRSFVVGEDLGTVEPGVREALAKHRMLSYRLASFEDEPPASYPELALTSVTTHDLPTLAGLWTGADVARSQAAGVPQNQAGVAALRKRLASLASGDADQTVADVIEKVHAALAAAPSRVLLATLDDALAVEERPNLPGAPAPVPNWSLALPVALDAFEEHPLPGKIARALTRPVPTRNS
jgi:4-alpha-glucanotransferase